MLKELGSIYDEPIKWTKKEKAEAKRKGEILPY